jgi:hypothetical protein
MSDNNIWTSSQKLSDSLAKPEASKDLAVALSGGGHRATLFGLGVLLALVDRGLNTCVKQISSVSGGSILNAFIATRCDFSKTSTSDFDNIAASIACKVVHRGVLTRPIIIALLSGILAPPLILLLLAYRAMISWWLAAPLVISWLCLALLRGLIVEWLIELRYFPPEIKVTISPPFLQIRRTRISSLSHNSIEHIICCTSLGDGRPVNFLLVKGGLLGAGEWAKQTVPHLAIASVVRASAAFPGIPPRRFRFLWNKSSPLGIALEAPKRKTIFLADGGVWNNLGSQMIRGGPLDAGGINAGSPLILADASAPLARQKLLPYYIPGWAFIRSLRRMINIQYANTVDPRIEPMRILQFRRLSNRLRKAANLPALEQFRGADLPFDMPVSLTTHPSFITNAFKEAVLNQTLLGKATSPEVATGGRVVGPLSFELQDLAGRAVDKIGTHLSRVHSDDAVGLLARGYLNAFLWTFELKPYENEEVDRLAVVPRRLRHMVSCGSESEMSPPLSGAEGNNCPSQLKNDMTAKGQPGVV